MRASLFAETVVAPADIGVAAVVPTPAPAIPPPARFHLLLEDVQDPGNVGTMLRTAAAAGVDQVLLSRQCAFAWSPKVLRAGQGAHFATTIVEDVDLVAWAAAFAASGRRSDRHGAARRDDALRREAARAVGGDGRQRGRGTVGARCCDRATRRVSIPMHEGTESLNAAAAAAVVLFELVRRRESFSSEERATRNSRFRRNPGMQRRRSAVQVPSRPCACRLDLA